MDTLTTLAAWTGAITGIGGLIVQYVMHRRTGAVLRIDSIPVHHQDEDGIEVRGVRVTIRNVGRHDVDVEQALIENRRPLGRARRWLYRRGIGRGGPERRAVGLGGSRRSVRIGGLSSHSMDARVATLHDRFGSDVEYVYPSVRTAAGKLVRGPRVPLKKWVS